MFEGKVVLIVGVGDGIGKAITYSFAKNLAKVFFVSRQKERGEELLSELKKINGNITFLNADCSIENEVLEIKNKILSTAKKIDILIINTGKWLSKLLEEHTHSDYDQLLNSNFKVHYLIYKNFASFFKSQKSGLIFTIVGIFGPRILVKNQSVYNATKAACLALSKSFAQELASFGVRLFVINPGQTPHKLISKKPHIKLETDPTLERQCVPEDIALFIEKIASSPEIFSTGSVFEIAGITSSTIF